MFWQECLNAITKEIASVLVHYFGEWVKKKQFMLTCLMNVLIPCHVSLLLIRIMPFLFFRLYLICSTDFYQDFWLIHGQKPPSSCLIFQPCAFITISKKNGLRYGCKNASHCWTDILFSMALNNTGLIGLYRQIKQLWCLMGIISCTIAKTTFQCPKMLNTLESVKYSNNYWYTE